MASKRGGGTFKDLLKEIVNSIPQGGNEPMIVQGNVMGISFTPTDGTILPDAIKAYKNGRVVLIKYIDPEDQSLDWVRTVIAYNDGTLDFGNVVWG